MGIQMGEGKDRLAALSPDKIRLFRLLEARKPLEMHPTSNSTEPDEIERRLTEIWQSVLRIDNIDPRDSYFRLGGDSIKSIQIAARARALGLAVTTPMILQNPTIARLAHALRAERSGADARRPRRADRNEYALTPAQAGILFETLAAPANELYRSCLSLRIEGILDVDILRLAWNRVFVAHPVLRTRFEWKRLEEPRQIVESDARCDLILEQAGEEASIGAALDKFKSHLVDSIPPLDQAPLCRVGVLRANARLHFLVLAHHHIILDGWSQQVLLRQLFETYLGYLDGYESELTSGPSFAAFVEHVNAAAAPSELWQAYFNGLSTPRYEAIVKKPSTSSTIRLEPSAVDTGRLASIAAGAEVTPAILFQAAVILALAERHACDDVVFGLVVSGRETSADFPSATEIVGLCINTLPMRGKIRNADSVSGWWRGLQNNPVLMAPHHHTSLGAVKRMLLRSGTEVAFDTLVVVENLPTVALDDPRLSINVESFDVAEGWPIVIVLRSLEPTVIEIKYRTGESFPDIAARLQTLLLCACTAIAECGGEGTVGHLRSRLSDLAKHATRHDIRIDASRRVPL